MTAPLLPFALMWLAGICDYLVQSLYFGWPTGPFPNHSTGRHLAWWLDWLPRDPYHVYQALRNALWLTAAWHASLILSHYPWWQSLGITIGLYIVARGLSSSLILRIVR